MYFKTNQGKLSTKHKVPLWFIKSLPWPLDIRGSKLSFYRNIFLSQYREQKYLLCIGP